MFPDLSALSQEEAALITDVLSRLSISNAPTGSAVPQNTPANGALQDPALLELDLAAWTIEQELRGLQGSSSFVPQPARVQRAPYAATHTPFPGVDSEHAPYLPGGAYGTAYDHRSRTNSAARGPWDQAAGPTAPPLPAADLMGFRPGFQGVVEPNGFAALQYAQHRAPSHPVDVTSSREVSLTSKGAPNPELQPLLRSDVGGSDARAEVQASNGITSPTSKVQPPTMSVLREMREKLRQQQRQQQQTLDQHQGQQLQQQQANSQSAFGPSPEAGLRGESSTAGSVTSAGVPKSPEKAQNGYTTQAFVPPAGGASPASTTAARARRALPSTPSAVAKAFTMLNARTSVDRYGPQPGASEGPSLSPTKAPVRLPDQERSARLQQLYERTSKWRQRCAERYAKERHDREMSELEECTFAPKITTASHLIMQGKSPSEVYQALSKGSTPTKHHRDFAEHDYQPSPIGSASVRPQSAQADSAGAAGTRPTGPGNMDTGSSACSTGHVGTAPSANESHAHARAASVSPPRPTVNSAEVGERLYNRAFEHRARQEARFFRQLLEEERQRRFVASSQGVSPRVYDPPAPPSSRFLPTGLEECTFQPNSYGSGFNRRPKSAPHLRGADGRHRTVTSPLFSIYGPPGMPARGNGGSQPHQRGNRAYGIHTTVSISPDLDWEEFLARQERFLAMREHRIQLLEQTDPPVPRMSPGSKKLLREREMRPGADGPGLQTEPSSRTAASSPGRQDRRVKTIMDMYKECTFQPQITRRAAALPSRQVEDFVDGGRARREEWRQHQLAMQQEREAENLTFKPQIFTNDAYSHVRPRINLKNPDAYLAHVADKRKQREALRAELDSEREAQELQQCTFKPQTTPLPAYLIRRLQEQHLQQLQAEQQMGQSIAWEESSGGLGDIDCDTIPGSDNYYSQRVCEPSSDYQPFDGYPAAVGHPQEDKVPDEPMEGSTFQQAYQRALQYANSLPIQDEL